jgi:hypothetical protein
VGHRQLKLSATKPTACFAHTFGLLAGKNADAVKRRSISDSVEKYRFFEPCGNKYLATTPGQKAVAANTGKAFLHLLYYNSSYFPLYFVVWLFYSLWYM